MKPLFPALLLLLALTGSAQAPHRTSRRAARPATERRATEAQVYGCTGPYARKWHRKPTCAGGNCSAAVRRMSLADARLRYDGPCGRCCR